MILDVRLELMGGGGLRCSAIGYQYSPEIYPVFGASHLFAPNNLFWLLLFWCLPSMETPLPNTPVSIPFVEGIPLT